MSTQSGEQTLQKQQKAAEAARKNGAGGFDLSEQARHLDREEEGRWVEVRGAGGKVVTYGADDRPVRALILGTYSKRFKAAQREHRRRLTEAGDRDLTEAESEAATHRLYAACVGEWEGFFEGGRPIECTKDNVVRSFELAPWWCNQVITEAGDHAGFSDSSTDS